MTDTRFALLCGALNIKAMRNRNEAILKARKLAAFLKHQTGAKWTYRVWKGEKSWYVSLHHGTLHVVDYGDEYCIEELLSRYGRKSVKRMSLIPNRIALVLRRRRMEMSNIVAEYNKNHRLKQFVIFKSHIKP